MKLAFYYRDYLYGGAYPRDTQLLVRALSQRVDHVFVYCYAKERSSEGEATSGNVTVRSYYVSKRLWFLNFFYIPEALRKRIAGNLDGVDALTIVGAFIPENYPIARLAYRTALPYAVSPGEPVNAFSLNGRGLKWIRKRLYATMCERFIMENAMAIQVCSHVHALHLWSLGFRVDRRRTFVGREAVDWETMRGEASSFDTLQRGESPRGELVFGYLGRLRTFHKGLDLLLQAWALYKKLGGRGRLELVGPGTTRETARLERLCARLKLPDVAILPPKYGNEKYLYLRTVSALVHPSRHDGITRVIREALASGCILITTYNTHVYELLDEMEAGYVTSVDALDLAMALKRFSGTTDDQRTSMREGARKVAAHLTWDRWAADFLHGIRQRVGRTPPRSAGATRQ